MLPGTPEQRLSRKRRVRHRSAGDQRARVRRMDDCLRWSQHRARRSCVKMVVQIKAVERQGVPGTDTQPLSAKTLPGEV
jgi:hypothetical protein